MNGFRGTNQAAGRAHPEGIGPINQRKLLRMMRVVIDTSQSKASSRGRDDARKSLTWLYREAHWNTPYVLRNLGVKRCRYLRGLGWTVPMEYCVLEESERERLRSNIKARS